MDPDLVTPSLTLSPTLHPESARLYLFSATALALFYGFLVCKTRPRSNPASEPVLPRSKSEIEMTDYTKIPDACSEEHDASDTDSVEGFVF